MSIPRGAYARKKIAGAIAYYGNPISGDIIEVIAGSCDYFNPSLECAATGKYQILITGATLQNIVWSTTVGTITGGQGTDIVQITTDSGVTRIFDLTITADVVPDNLDPTFPGSRTEEFTHTHTDTSVPLTIVSINRDSGGTCIFPPAGSCQATSVFSATTANGNGPKIYKWSVTGDATISGSTTGSTVTVVGLDDADNDVYNVSVIIDDNTQTGANDTQQFTDTKTQDIPISITSINRDSGGTCEFPQSGTCVAQSVYSVQFIENTGTVLYSWSVDGGASIPGNIAQPTVTVNGPDTGTNDSYNVTCIVTDDNSNDTEVTLFSDSKSLIPINITNITRTSGGTCEYPSGGTCVAASTYSATVSQGDGTYSYLWSVDGGASIDGLSNQPTVMVNGPDTGSNDSYNVTCQVSDATGNDSLQKSFSDNKTQEIPSLPFDPLGWTALPQTLNSGASVGDQIYGAAASDDGQTIIACFQNGWAARSTDGGANWVQAPKFLNAGATVGQCFIAVASKDNVWVSGSQSGYASRSTDNGVNWVPLVKGLNSGNTTQSVITIETDGDGVYISGHGFGYASRSIDNGATWTALPQGLNSGGTVNINRIATDRNGTWVAVCNDGFASRSIDNGATWSALPVGLNSSVEGIFEVKTTRNGTWIASGGNCQSRSVDNGATWANMLPLHLNSGGTYNHSMGASQSGVWVCANLSGFTSYSLDDGVTWITGIKGLNSGSVGNTPYMANLTGNTFMSCYQHASSSITPPPV